jgi:hypothetical protein
VCTMVSVAHKDVASLACRSEIGGSMRLNLGLGPITRDGTRASLRASQGVLVLPCAH